MVSRTFDGWAIRYGVHFHDRGKPDRFTDIISFAPVFLEGVAVLEHGFRKRVFRQIDAFPFRGVDKARVGMVYHRFIPVDGDVDDFARFYLGEEAPLVSPDPAAPHAVRGSVEGRAQELATLRGAHRRMAEWKGAASDPTVDDPWYDVETAYQFYRARALVRVRHGFDETVWFASAGIDDDVEARFGEAIQEHAQTVGGEVVEVRGPRPADSLAHPGLGLTFAVGLHAPEGGTEEFEATVITLSRWQ